MDSVMSSYELFIGALTGRYLQAVAPGTTITPRAVQDVLVDASKLRESFMMIADKQLRATADEAIKAAPAREAEIHSLVTHTLLALGRIARSDIATVNKDMRAGRHSLASIMRPVHGAMGMLVQNAVAAPDYRTLDSAGRRWESKKLAAFLIRDFAYQVSVEVGIGEAIARGDDLAQVAYNDPSHAGHGAVFSISGKAKDVASFDSIRAKYFHPNASAKVVPYVAP